MQNEVEQARLKSEAGQMKFASAASVFLHVFEKEITAAMDAYDARFSHNKPLGRATLKEAMDAYDRMKQADDVFLSLYRQKEALEKADTTNVM